MKHFKIENLISICVKILLIKQDTNKVFSTTRRSMVCQRSINFSLESFWQIPQTS